MRRLISVLLIVAGILIGLGPILAVEANAAMPAGAADHSAMGMQPAPMSGHCSLCDEGDRDIAPMAGMMCFAMCGGICAVLPVAQALGEVQRGTPEHLASAAIQRTSVAPDPYPPKAIHL